MKFIGKINLENLGKCFRIFLIVVFCSQLAFSNVNDFSHEKLQNIFQELNIPVTPVFLDKLQNSLTAIMNINNQTNGNLGEDKWINVFEKMELIPKDNMNISDWQSLFDKLRINYIKNVVIEDNIKPTNMGNLSPILNTDIPQIEPKVIFQDKEIDEKSYPKITLDFKDMDILTVLKILSKKSGLTIIAGNNVKGKISVYLEEMDSFKALKLILEMNDYAYIKTEDIVKVITLQDYERIYGKKFYDRTVIEYMKLKYVECSEILNTLNSLKSKVGEVVIDKPTNSIFLIDTPSHIKILKSYIESLDVEKQTNVFSLNYADPKVLEEKLKNYSSTINVKMDERNSKLVVTDLSTNMEKITKLINAFDDKPQGVLVEAKIVQVVLNDDLKMGINWESAFSQIDGKGVAGSVVANMSNTQGSSMKLTLGTLEVNKFKAVFDFLQTIGNTNLLSTPRIATLENQEAKILVGTKEAYVTTEIVNAGTTTTSPIVSEKVQFLDVGVKLYVTPKISNDDYIIMKIRPEVSSVDRTITTAQKNEIPIVRTSESETNVMVKNGHTIIIAGLIEDKEIEKFEGVPFLSKIPLLGALFRRTTKTKTKTELVIFLTPKIMTGDETNIVEQEKFKK